MDSKQSTVQGIKWTFYSAIISNILGVIQISILARLLNKSDFGLMAIVNIVIGFSDIFIDIGVSNAIIYKRGLSREKLSTLYWMNVLIGFLFFIILYEISSPLSVFYHVDELEPLLNLVAATFLIKPWGQQQMVLMQKNLQFNTIAIIEVVARVISFSLTVSAAFIGLGVYSLAIGVIAVSLFSTIGYFVKGGVNRYPLLYLNFREIDEEIRFGLYQMGEKVLNYFSAQFDVILIGRLLGMDILGLYSIVKTLAGKLFYLINPIISKVTFPIMAKMNNDLDCLRRYHLIKIKIISYISFPIYLFFFILGSPVLYLFLGSEWLNAAPVFSVISLSYLVLSIANPMGVLLLSIGKAKTSFYWNLYAIIVYPLSIWVGSFNGIFGIIYASLLMQVINYFISLHFIVKPIIGITIRSNLSVILKPALFSVCCAILASIAVSFLTDYGTSLIIGGLVFFLPFIFLVYYFDRDTAASILQILRAI